MDYVAALLLAPGRFSAFPDRAPVRRLRQNGPQTLRVCGPGTSSHLALGVESASSLSAGSAHLSRGSAMEADQPCPGHGLRPWRIGSARFEFLLHCPEKLPQQEAAPASLF